MGNHVSIGFDDGDDSDADLDVEWAMSLEENSASLLRQTMASVIGNMANVVRTMDNTVTDLPVIRKNPDLRTFRHTVLYKEIKSLSGLPANSRRPTDRFSLVRGLMKRENGLAGYPPGSFTANQQRRIANLYLPNKKDVRLMSLESKVFVSKHNKDGSRLITASQDSLIRVYDSSKGTYHRINRIRAEDVNYSVLDIDFSPCGEYFAYSTWADYFFIVPVNGTAEDFQWLNLNVDQNRAGIFCIRFSPDGRKLIGGCNNSCIYLADRETQRIKSIKTDSSSHLDVNAVSYVSDRDMNLFVSGCDSGILKLWDARCIGQRGRHHPVGAFVGHFDGITYIDPRNDGNHVLTNSKDQSIKIWDIRMPTPSDKVKKHTIEPLLDWDYRYDSVPREYYNPTKTIDGDVSVMTYRGHRVTKSLLRAKFSPLLQTGQRYIYTGCGTGRIIIYDILTGQIKEAIEGHRDIVRDLSWHPIRSEIVSSSWDTHVNLNTFKRDPFRKRHSSVVNRQPLRRSRRIAHQNGDLDDEEEDQEVGIA